MIKMMSQGGPPQGAAYQGNPTPTGNFLIIDMIPQDVKVKMPASALEQLKDVKTPADLKAKIEQLINAKKTLSSEVNKLTKQRSDTLAKIAETEAKHKDMLTAVSSIEAAKADMNDTVSKMTVMKNAVPRNFEETNNNYLAAIDKLSPKIESEFQDTLNGGFRQIYLTTGIAALMALIILMFYRKKEYKAIAE
jgi:seryl-tRNA synthetase